MKLLLLYFLFLQSSWALTFDRYHNVAEINAYMKEQAVKRPSFAKYEKLGNSPEGREIGVLRISGNNSGSKEAVYFNGTHHGDEKSSTEAVLALMDYFLSHRDDPTVADLLSKYELYFQPLVNPDGHARNTRVTSLGVDMNRDYSYPGRSDEDSFKQVETQLVKKLADRMKFRGAIAYHSGIVEILWPWCHTPDPSHDDSIMEQITRTMAEATGVTRFMASYFDYPTKGEFIDYVYWKNKTVALTVELSEMKTPPVNEIPAINKTAINGAISFLKALEAAPL